MATKAGTGTSTLRSSKLAAAEAVQRALVTLGNDKPTFGFLFASPDLALTDALDTARELTKAEIVGCSSAGEITEAGATHGGVSVMLCASAATTEVRFASGLKADPERVARELGANLPALKKAGALNDNRHLTTVLLTDGLSGTGERLVAELYEHRIQSGTQIVGGAAGDEGRFKETWVGARTGRSVDAAAALHVFSDAPWGVGVAHGLRPTTKQMRVTKAERNIVYEIDGQSAFAVYQKHAASRNVQLTAENASSYLVANELGIHFFERLDRARAALSVGPGGSLVCAADIPKGSMVSILDGEPESMIRAAQSAARAARAGVKGPVAGVLIFDCVCRGMILKEAFSREIEAVRAVFPGAPMAGFLTYGEVARSHEQVGGWHNATVVVVAVPA